MQRSDWQSQIFILKEKMENKKASQNRTLKSRSKIHNKSMTRPAKLAQKVERAFIRGPLCDILAVNIGPRDLWPI